MLTKEKALQIANEWIEAWNEHNIERIVSQYSSDIEYTTPLAVKLLNFKDGTIIGIKDLKKYFNNTLSISVDLKFELINVCFSVNSIVICYKSVLAREVVEVLFLDQKFKIYRAIAHYKNI